jgi:hypothetical protein
MAIPVSLAEVVEAGTRTANARVRVSLPAKVVTYDPVTNTITAKVQVKDFYFDEDGEREYEELPVLPSVPVQWPRAGGKIVRLPLTPGDGVLLVFSSLSLAEWRLTGQVSEPKDSRRNSIGYCFAVPGAFPDTSPVSPADAVEVTAGGMIVGDDGGSAQMIVGGTIPGVRFGKFAISPIALAVPTDAALATAVAAINTVIASLNSLISAYNGHTHVTSCGAGAGSATATPSQATPAVAGPGAPGTTASLLVKSM